MQDSPQLSQGSGGILLAATSFTILYAGTGVTGPLVMERVVLVIGTRVMAMIGMGKICTFRLLHLKTLMKFNGAVRSRGDCTGLCERDR
jgi:hypothetical protein